MDKTSKRKKLTESRRYTVGISVIIFFMGMWTAIFIRENSVPYALTKMFDYTKLFVDSIALIASILIGGNFIRDTALSIKGKYPVDETAQDK